MRYRFVWLTVLVAGCGGSSSDSRKDGGPTIDVGPPPSVDPVEPVWEPNKVEARVKSPGQRMHFTENLPFRILADANDPLAYQCPPGHPPYVCPDSKMEFFVDGANLGTVPPDPDDMNLWELRLPNGLPAGDHVITVKFTPHSDSPVDGLVPIYIKVDPLPSKSMMSLNADIVLSGGMDLDWTDKVVIGNGHKVTGTTSGKVIIKNSLVTGLAAFDNKIGLDVTTSGGVDIQGSTFEATAPMHLVVNGGTLTINKNEFRSSNYVTYVSNEPTKSPILDIAGGTSGAKLFQGNNVGAGIVLITNMSGWQIGGLKDSEGNIFVGPRCVLQLDNSNGAKIQGNYFHHDYYGGFSQGYNVDFNGSDNALAEHNVIRDGSWPVQTFGGEFRYNLVINSGHDFMRSAEAGAKIHHNIFAHAQAPNSGYDGAVFFYDGETNVVFDNNTIDAGGEVADYNAPAITLANSNISLASLRNNVFTNFSDTVGWNKNAIVAGGRQDSTVNARIMKGDYNAFSNPLASGVPHYVSGIVSGTAGSHDVSADPMFNGMVPETPYKIDEGLVWTREFGVSGVLGYYRGMYTPRTGSPLIDAGETTDGGSGNDIGAIGAGAANTNDKFGLVLEP